MTYITEEVRGQVDALAVREKALARRFKWLLPVWVLSAMVTVGAGVLAHFQGPDARPSNIDIPAQLLGYFSDKVPGALPYTSAVGQFGELAGALQPIVFGMSVIAAFAGAGMLFAGMVGSGTRLVMAGCIIAASVTMLGAFNDPSSSQHSSPRHDFVQAVENHRVGAVVKHLERVNQEASPAGQYVIAQLSIAKGQGRLVNDELVRLLRYPASGFTPKAEALYAIEKAAYGEPKSSMAIAYQEEREERKRLVRWVAVALGVLSFSISVAGFGFLALRRIIVLRVRRIRGLMGLHAEPKTLELDK